METTNNNMQEMEQMRSQLEMLKQKLEKQDIVNDRLMRRSMKRKMSWIDKYRWIVLLCIPFVALCFLPTFLQMGLSWWLYGFTVIMVTVSAIADWFINRMPEREFMKDNLLETAERLTRMKKIRSRQTVIGIVVCFFWILWLVYELYQAGAKNGAESGEMALAWGYIVAVVVGLIVGLIIGLSIFFKMQRTNDEIIDEIEQLKRDER